MPNSSLSISTTPKPLIREYRWFGLRKKGQTFRQRLSYVGPEGVVRKWLQSSNWSGFQHWPSWICHPAVSGKKGHFVFINCFTLSTFFPVWLKCPSIHTQCFGKAPLNILLPEALLHCRNQFYWKSKTALRHKLRLSPKPIDKGGKSGWIVEGNQQKARSMLAAMIWVCFGQIDRFGGWCNCPFIISWMMPIVSSPLVSISKETLSPTATGLRF